MHAHCSGNYSPMTQFSVSLGSVPPQAGSVAMAAWFAVQAKPNAAHIAARNLVRQGFEVFLPLERYSLRRGRSFVPALRPYFSGYLFVGFDPEVAPWRAIRSTYGVMRLVCFGATPASVDMQLINELKLACDGEGIMHAQLDARPGDPLRVAAGPLAGLTGKLEGLAPQERAWLLLEVMGQPTRVSLPLTALRSAG